MYCAIVLVAGVRFPPLPGCIPIPVASPTHGDDDNDDDDGDGNDDDGNDDDGIDDDNDDDDDDDYEDENGDDDNDDDEIMLTAMEPKQSPSCTNPFELPIQFYCHRHEYIRGHVDMRARMMPKSIHTHMRHIHMQT